ncbi:MAG: DUF4832 domain-containing protein [Clostridia bacterium]|nr:DUF4832 domain-containing protein [Clostridia bacterium]
MYDYPNRVEHPEPLTAHAIEVGHWDVPNRHPYYRDLRQLSDDRRILRNPHKGWYWHYIDNGYPRPNYRADHDPSDHLEDFPGLNHLYLRFDWGDIEKEEGVYDWSYIDSIMEEWSRYDYRFSLRLVTYEGSGAIPFATPEYVYKAGARCYALPGGRLEPDYGDPIFLDKLARFMEEAGRKFNGDPRIELVDVGTFGTWGEGHTGNGSDIIYPAEVIKKHIDLHVKNFPDKFVILNDDHINHRWSRGQEENLDLIDYAASLGLGLDDDSVCVSCYAANCGYSTLRTPWLFEYFYPNAPVVLEFEHYTAVAPEIFKNAYPFLEAMQQTHATFAGFHGYPRPWLRREPWFTEYGANRLGYWFFVEGIELPPLMAGVNNRIRLYIANRGFAASYRKFELKFRLAGDGVNHTQVLDVDCRRWKPGEVTEEDIAVRPAVEPGSYGVELGLFEGGRPIELALKESVRTGDGFYRLGKVEVR